MPARLLQLNLDFSVTPTEYEQAVSPLADEFARVEGLRWKIWIMNTEAREAGGIYLFDDQESVDAFLNGPLAAQVAGHPALANLTVKVFDVMDELTAVTRGPVALAARH